MKTKKHRSRNVPNPVARGFPPAYEPSFKRTVILYAEQKNSNREARKRFGISEETIRRWRKLRKEIMEKAQQSIRRSQRHSAASHGSFSESSSPLEKEKVSYREKKELECDELYLDSMPLQQRLSQNHNESPPVVHQPQETVLHSQPISPTKLKVTRQGKPQAPPPRVSTPPPPPPPPEVCLRWDSHHTNMQSTFPNLLTKEQYVDATLVSEGKTLKCHRMILSSCSPYFEDVLSGIGPLQHPVLFMKDVPFWILKALCDFMYAGEVHILQDKLQEFLKVASTLKIKGLTDPPGKIEDSKPIIPTIKQEVEATPPPHILEKPLKQEKEDEPPPPAPKPIKLEVTKPSKKKEDKKSKHASHTPKEKEKEKVVEEPPLPKVTPKAPPKIVTKVALPKVPPSPRTALRNVVRNVVKPIPKPSTSKTSHNSRKSETLRQRDKHKVEVTAQKEKEKVVGSQKEKQEKEKAPLKKDNINDPLDLLRPVYEEIAKEPPQVPKSIGPGKLKERGNVPVKKTVNKKVKKRRYAEYAEDREESPPPVFLSRKGTRSRPNVKIPKFFHTHFDDSPKETSDATIVREPHTVQNDPLIGAEMEEIKAEPVDVEENTIEMEANIVSVNYMVQDQEMISQEGEEIIGNYDSPLVNIKIEPKGNTPSIFKKEIHDQPVIMDVHTVTETDESLLNIKQENLEIVGPSTDRLEETMIIGSNFDAPSEIIISNVQSMAGVPEESPLKEKQSEEILPTLPVGDIELPNRVDEFSKSFVSVDDRTLEGTKIGDQAKESGDNLALSEPDPLAQSQGPGKEQELMETDEIAGLNPERDNHKMEMDRENVGNSEVLCDSGERHNVEPFGLVSEELVRANEASSEVTRGSLREVMNNDDIENANSSPQLCRSELETLEQCAEFSRASSEQMELKESASTTTESAVNLLETLPTPDEDFTIEKVAEGTSDFHRDSNTPPGQTENSHKLNKLIISEPESGSGTLAEDQNGITAAQNASVIRGDEVPEASENAAEKIDCAAIAEVDLSVISSSGNTDAVTSEVDESLESSEHLQPETREISHETPIEQETHISEKINEEVISDTDQTVSLIKSSETVDLNVNRQRSVDIEATLGTEAKNNEEAAKLDDNMAYEEKVVNVTPPRDAPLVHIQEPSQDKDLTENIEAELEKCLASSSSVVSPKSSEGRLKVNAKPLPFEDDEDFSSFIGGNRPANYLGDDFGSDFEMNQFDREEHCHKSDDPNSQVEEIGRQSQCCHDGSLFPDSRINEGELTERKVLEVEESSNNDLNLVDMNEPHTLNIDNKLDSENVESNIDEYAVVDDLGESVREVEIANLETTKETTEESSAKEEKSEAIENIQISHPCNEIAPSNFVGCKKLDFDPESEEQSACPEEESHLEQPTKVQSHEEEVPSVSDAHKVDFHVVKQSEIDFSLDEPQTKSVAYEVRTNYCNQEAEEVAKNEIYCNPIQNSSKEETEEQKMDFILDDEQSTSTVVERIKHPSPTDSPICADDEKRMEETLLADLDDDIEMKDVTASKEEEGSEKTLEMIVNDLNESLGDMTD